MAEDKKTLIKKKKINPEKYIELNPHLDEDSSEDASLDERAPLTIQQRKARGRTMRRLKTRMKTARKRASRKKASTEKLKTRARKKARSMIRDRLSAGKKYSDMSPSEKVQLDKRLHRIPDAAINRIATRQLPQVRRAEMDRLARMRGGSSKNESLDSTFEHFLFERRICPPKKPHMAMTKEGKVKFDRRFKFFRKEAQTKLDELFIEEAQELMGLVESFIEESVDPADREQGTDSLVKIYKKDTPGQKQESYFSSDISNSFGSFRKGSRVSFSSHSMDMADDDVEKEGTVVGSTVQHLRVRDDDGILYLVRHNDAMLIESAFVFTLDEMFEFEFISENVLDKAISAIHKVMIKGKSFESVVWDFSAASGFRVPTKDLIDHYKKNYGDTAKKPSKMTDKDRETLIRKYS